MNIGAVSEIIVAFQKRFTWVTDIAFAVKE